MVKLTKAYVSQMPWRDGDGYSYGGEVILNIGDKALLIGSGRDARELADEIARRWNVDFDDTPEALEQSNEA